MIENINLPPPLTVLGFFYVLVAAAYFLCFIKSGYYRHVGQNLITMFKANYKLIVPIFLLFLFLVSFIDLPLALWCKKHYIASIYHLLDIVNSMGEGWFVGGVVFSLLMLFKLFHAKEMTIISKISLMAMIYAGLFNTLAKCLINRERPGIAMNQWHFFRFLTSGAKHYDDLFYAYNSMPSGHTITIAAALTPFLLYAHSIISRIVMLSIVVIICFARLYTLNHWLSDVYISLILGFSIAYAVYQANYYRFTKPSAC